MKKLLLISLFFVSTSTFADPQYFSCDKNSRNSLWPKPPLVRSICSSSNKWRIFFFAANANWEYRLQVVGAPPVVSLSSADAQDAIFKRPIHTTPIQNMRLEEVTPLSGGYLDIECREDAKVDF